MEFSVIEGKGYVVAGVSGRLDATSCEDFETFINGLMNKDHNYIILNCVDLTYISSAGLRSLVVLMKKMQEFDGQLCLLNVHGLVLEVIETSGFDHIIQICESIDEAQRGAL